MLTVRSSIRVILITASPALLVCAAVLMLRDAAGGLHLAPVAGVAAWAMAVVWAVMRIHRLLGVALILEGVEHVQRTLADRGVVVSREKALMISAGLCEAQRVAREAKAKRP